ncbi:MAG: MFS transporter [Nitrososphaerota archaeon]
MNRRVAALFLGHLANDSLYSSLPPLLPLLVATYGLSTALVGAIPAVYMMVASFLQPLFGQLFDRMGKTWMMSVGLLMGGLALMSLGYMESYPAIVAAAAIGGLGSAIFHPVATSLSSNVEGDDRASNVSVFMLGGNLGLSIGPLIILSTLTTFHIRGTFMALVLPAIAALILFRLRAGLSKPSTERVGGVRVNRWALLLVLLASVLRGTATITLITYLPLYITSLGLSVGVGGLMLAVMLLSGGLGMVVAGRIGDRFNKMLSASALLFSAGPAVLLFSRTSSDTVWLLAGVMGFTLLSAHPLIVVIAHELLPDRTGLASALTYGVAFGLSNLFIPLIGSAIDVVGFSGTLQAMAALPVLAGLATLLTYRIRAVRREQASASTV